MTDKVEQLGGLIGAADRITAFTGAGISAESGISTYRGDDGGQGPRPSQNIAVTAGEPESGAEVCSSPDSYSSGLWQKYDPNFYANIDFFLKDPTYYWDFFREVRYPLLVDALPNKAHQALVRLEKGGKLSTVITQNIDGLHQEAGSNRVIELHGNTRRIYCMSCGIDYSIEAVFEIVKKENPPPCTSCGGMLRPAVVFFGEQLPPGALDEAMEEARACDLMLG